MTSGPYPLEEYYPPARSDRDLPAATSMRAILKRILQGLPTEAEEPGRW
jgi:hypothetical protein